MPEQSLIQPGLFYESDQLELAVPVHRVLDTEVTLQTADIAEPTIIVPPSVSLPEFQSDTHRLLFAAEALKKAIRKLGDGNMHDGLIIQGTSAHTSPDLIRRFGTKANVAEAGSRRQ